MGIAKGDEVYKVLARKYRPTKLDEVVGQDVAVRILKNAISSNRLHHAILLAGPMGVGKTSTARIIAKSLNCSEGPTIEPCNKCESCVSISEGKNVDVYEIDGASNRKVEDARSIIESVKYPPLKSRYKIYIIDEVHMFTQEAFNALLKTIEEPPDYVKFIFATTAMDKLPDTILSRCQILNLKKIPKDIIKLKLKDIVSKEQISIEDDALDIVAFASFGSLRVAEGYLDRCISYSNDTLTTEDVSIVVGITDVQTVEKYFGFLFNKDAESALDLIKELYNKDVNFEVLAKQCIEYLLNAELQDEYKAGLLNIYYKALLDIKQGIDSLSVFSIASYKSVAISNLDKIGDVVEKLLNASLSPIIESKEESIEIKYKQQANDNINPVNEEIAKNDQVSKENNETQITSKYVEKILNEFGGKIVSVEKINN